MNASDPPTAYYWLSKEYYGIYFRPCLMIKLGRLNVDADDVEYIAVLCELNDSTLMKVT